MVLPLRVNDYVLSQVIDWSAIPSDPMFQLVLPHDVPIAGGDSMIMSSERVRGHLEPILAV